MSAPQAKNYGLINEVFDDLDAAQAACADFLSKMSLCAPGAVAATKEAIMNTVGQAPSSFMINYLSSDVFAIRSGTEAKAGIEAMTSKKKPVWAESTITA